MENIKEEKSRSDSSDNYDPEVPKAPTTGKEPQLSEPHQQAQLEAQANIPAPGWASWISVGLHSILNLSLPFLGSCLSLFKTLYRYFNKDNALHKLAHQRKRKIEAINAYKIAIASAEYKDLHTQLARISDEEIYLQNKNYEKKLSEYTLDFVVTAIPAIWLAKDYQSTQLSLEFIKRKLNISSNSLSTEMHYLMMLSITILIARIITDSIYAQFTEPCKISTTEIDEHLPWKTRLSLVGKDLSYGLAHGLFGEGAEIAYKTLLSRPRYIPLLETLPIPKTPEVQPRTTDDSNLNLSQRRIDQDPTSPPYIRTFKGVYPTISRESLMSNAASYHSDDEEEEREKQFQQIQEQKAQQVFKIPKDPKVISRSEENLLNPESFPPPKKITIPQKLVACLVGTWGLSSELDCPSLFLLPQGEKEIRVVRIAHLLAFWKFSAIMWRKVGDSGVKLCSEE